MNVKTRPDRPSRSNFGSVALQRINSLQMNVLNLSEAWIKIVKCSFICFVLLFSYIYLFAVNARDHDFLLTGSAIGFASSGIVVWNCVSRRDSNGNWPPQISLLFWRAICEAGTGFRFILGPAFNLYICHSLNCTRESGDPDRCALPSFMLEFFVLASECWFLCNGLDLYYSITNPFFSFSKRIMYYHTFCWSTALFFAASPFFMMPKWQEIYGFWFINPNIDDTANCWIKITFDNYAWPIWVYFFVPLLCVYLVCLFSLIVAYMRLRRGVTKSFLPRMRLLIMNTINLVVHMLYWAVFVLFYAWTFWTKSQFKSGASQPTNNIIYFVMGSKGCSALLVWILTANNSQLGLTAKKLKTDADENVMETIDANKALREEVLSFATAGIRSSARAGAKLTPDRKMISRRPQQHESTGSEAFRELINPGFFLRFILGYTDELRELEELVANKQRSVNETFMRQTVTAAPSAASSLHQRHLNNARSSTSDADSGGSRLSQRPTIVSGTEATRNNPSIFQRMSMSIFRTPSVSDQHSNQAEDPENGLELNDFGDESDRRSSMMIETEHQGGHTKQSSERFDLASTKEFFWRSVYNFFLDPSESVEFTEFEPYHFRRVRLAGGISDAVYSMYFATTIKERLTQGGASGAFFFFSKGEKFIAKSCSGAELDTLTNNAVAYADYMESNKDSYISRIYGAYRLQIYGNALYFFVMNNIFLNAERLAMNEKYDIKGSWVARNATPPHNNMTVTCTYCEQKYVFCGTKKKKQPRRKPQRDLVRSISTDKNVSTEAASSNVLANLADLGMLNTTTSPLQSHSRSHTRSGETHETDDSGEERGGCPYTVSGEHEPNVILKDNDIKYKIRLPRNTTESLLTQIRSDAEFLHSIGVMDYSLLVGVHNTEYEVMAEDPGSTVHTLVKAHSASFGSARDRESPLTPQNLSPKGSQQNSYQSSLGSSNSASRSESESTTHSALNTKRPFADADAGRPSAASTVSTSSTGTGSGAVDQSGSDSPGGTARVPSVQVSPSPASPARNAGNPSANTTASAYLAAAAQYGLSTGTGAGAGGSAASSDGSSSHGSALPTSGQDTAHGGRSNMGLARLSRLSVGVEGQSFASVSVAHSQDTENAGDLGFARKLEVYRVVGPDAYFMGIIDFQQKWTISKRIERFIKVNIYGWDGEGTSAIEPTTYRDRFLKKVEDILDSDYAYQSRFVPTEPTHGSSN